METFYLDSPVGVLEIVGNHLGISKIQYMDTKTNFSENTKTPKILLPVVTQLKEYFNGERIHFELKLNPQGTEFQKKVWNQLLTIPYGKTASYQQMANQLGDPKVIRAAASANGKNPISIVIPCHRVIGSDGSLTGYAGGLHRKKWLLDYENPVKQGNLF